MKKRLISLLLAFVMVVGIMPMNVLAVETTDPAETAQFVIKVNDAVMELVDAGTQDGCDGRFVSDPVQLFSVTVPTGTKTVTVELKDGATANYANIQYMNGAEHIFGGNAMPAFEADITNYDGLCISCDGKYYHISIAEQEKVGEYQSITTDMEGSVIVSEQEKIVGWVSYYHAVVPRGSSYAYITYPADTINVHEGQAHVTEWKFDGSHCPDKYWPATTNADGSVTVELPIADLITEGPGTGTAPCFWKPDGSEVLEGFTFSYAEDTTIFLVTQAVGNGYTTDGLGYVKTGEDYTFTIDIKNGYDAADMVVKVNGEVVKADENGVYTVPAVTEDLVITVEGVEPFPVDGDVTFYFSVEKGNKFVEQGGRVWALEEVTVPYFDLALYDMEYLYYNPDCYINGQASQAPGTAETAKDVVTMLHALIWLTEVYYNDVDPEDAGKGMLATELDWNGFEVYSAKAGSAFFYMWDFDYNFNYYLNYEYPLGGPGWGSTCDQIKLNDGDVVSMRYNDNSGTVGTYHHFGEKGLVTKSVTQGESFALDIYRTGQDNANYTTPIYKVGEGHKVYLIPEAYIDVDPTNCENGVLVGTTNADGNVTIDTAEVEPGVYYLASNSSSPAVMLLTVEAGEEPAPEYKSGYGITVMVDGEEMELVANGTEPCGTLEAQKLNVTVPAGTTEVTFVNITDEVLWSQMYVYSGAHDWTEYASNVTEATISLEECGTTFCVSDSANKWYHVNIIVEEPAPEYKSEYGITVMVGGEEMDLVANGTEPCGTLEAQKLNVTVPAGTTEVTFVNITDEVLWSQMYVYSGAHDWTEYASNVTEATISLEECGTTFCVSDSANKWYHVNIIVEENDEPIASGWSGDTTWTLSKDGVLTFSGEGNIKNYGYTGTQPWVAYKDQIKEVIVNEGVVAVGSGAFMNLTALEKVTLPENGLEKIGEAAFYGCSALTEIHIPDTIYTIWAYTFKNCTSLNYIRLPKYLVRIAQGAFEGCTAMDYVYIPGETEIIGAWSFKGCTGLKEVDMTYADATEIKEGAFKNCKKLRTIAMPENLKVIGESAFYGIGAAEVVIPGTVTEVGAWAYARAGIVSVTFEGDAPAIGEGAFNKIEVTAYYPVDNATWTADVMGNYGGTVTWEAK